MAKAAGAACLSMVLCIHAHMHTHKYVPRMVSFCSQITEGPNTSESNYSTFSLDPSQVLSQKNVPASLFALVLDGM